MTGPSTAPVATATPAPAGGTVTGLVGEILTDAQKLARQQLEMFKAEVREDMNRTRQALIYGGVAVACLTVGAFASIFAVVHILDRFVKDLPLWGAWTLFAVIFLAAGVALGVVARNLFESFNPLPDKTFNALQDNLTGLRTAAAGNG